LHRGRGIDELRASGIKVTTGVLATECSRLNEAFNHWIVHRTPFVTVKAAMTLDGKIATTSRKSKWITSKQARACGMKLRCGADAILVGINTVLTDDPSLTLRLSKSRDRKLRQPRRIVLDAKARTPLSAKVITDAFAEKTTIVVGEQAPNRRVNALSKRVDVCIAPSRAGKINLGWLLQKLGAAEVIHLLVEGGGEVNASFLEEKHVHRIAFFYAPKIIGGATATKAVAGEGVRQVSEAVRLRDVQWRRVGPDLLLTARIE
jgi:diaminohydroxyphosphoribosylaminopyrimidine deaminase/5-amino-6-(5-phosphoribosylamino)uracil reductase